MNKIISRRSVAFCAVFALQLFVVGCADNVRSDGAREILPQGQIGKIQECITPPCPTPVPIPTPTPTPSVLFTNSNAAGTVSAALTTNGTPLYKLTPVNGTTISFSTMPVPNIAPGQNVGAFGTNGVLTVDTNAQTATADAVSNGIDYHIVGTLNSDGVSATITIQGSDGSSDSFTQALFPSNSAAAASLTVSTFPCKVVKALAALGNLVSGIAAAVPISPHVALFARLISGVAGFVGAIFC